MPWLSVKNSEAIIPLMKSNDPAVAVAATSAAGRIADKDSLNALMKFTSETLKDTRYTALAACIGTMAVDGNAKTAAKAAEKLMEDADTPDAVMAACAKARLLHDPDFYMEGVKISSVKVREALVRHADKVDNKVLAKSMMQACTPGKVAVITKLAAKNAKECAPAIAEMLNSDKPEVAVAALKALCKLGTAEHVPAMFAKMSSDDDAVKNAAQYALEDMLCPATSSTLIKTAGNDIEKQKSVLKILGQRMKADDIPAFTAFVKSADSGVRSEAWKALGNICDEKTYPQLLALLPNAQQNDASRAASAINAAIGNVDADKRANALISAWKCEAPGARIALTEVMLRYSDDRYVPIISKAMSSSNKAVAENAIRTLGGWPTLKPYKDLVNTLKTQSDANLKKAAYRGALKLAMAKGGNNAVKMCIDLFKEAPTDKDRETLATLYYKEKNIELFKLLKSCFNTPKAAAKAKLLYIKYYNDKVKPSGNIAAGKELDPKKWKVNASHNNREAKRAIDRNDGSRWTSGQSKPGMWFTVDLGEKSYISEIIMDTTRSANDTPNGCEVYVSDNGKNWGKPVAKTDGNSKKTTTVRMAASGRHIKIVTTGKRKGLHWSIHELYIKSGVDKKLIDEIKKTAESL